MIFCHRSNKIVFQCLTAILFLFAVHFSESSFAQSFNEVQWRSKSAKTLTIFQPGDAVRIQIWERYEEIPRNLNLSRDYPINPEGYIIMPLIGEVKVNGLTVYELMQLLEEKFKAYLKNPYVDVRPLIRVTMQGAFNRPGAYRVDPQSSLWDLVELAAGPRMDCDLKRMSVERGGKVVIKRLLNSFEKGYSLEEVGIETGDQIIVPRRGNLDLGVILGMVNLATSVVLLYLRLRFGSW